MTTQTPENIGPIPRTVRIQDHAGLWVLVVAVVVMMVIKRRMK